MRDHYHNLSCFEKIEGNLVKVCDKESPQPRLRWVVSQYGTVHHLRHVGKAFALASVHQRSRGKGQKSEYTVYIRGSLAGKAEDLKDARQMARELLRSQG